MKSTIRITLAAIIFAVIPSAVNAQLYNGRYPSFVPQDSLPHFKQILPAYPDTASVAFFNDYYQYTKGKELRNTPRGEQAKYDAELENFEVMLKGFADAFGMEITQAKTPELYNLFFWVKNDASGATYRTKQTGFRKRPFVQFHEGTLVPVEEADHITSSSYPSNHSAAGWAVALVMIQLNPANRDAILKRGYEYGQSRVICGYHYQSDVDAARLCASAALAMAEVQPFFQKQFAKAQKEYQQVLKAMKK